MNIQPSLVRAGLNMNNQFRSAPVPGRSDVGMTVDRDFSSGPEMHLLLRPGTGALHSRRIRQRGFTLIELLLVLVILGILAAIVVPKFAGRTEQARLTAAATQISAFSTSLDMFEADNGYYPKGKAGLMDLVQQPRDAQSWKGPYVKEIPKDPWGNEYVYECPGRQNASSYDLLSAGPDGKAGSEDDITNWSKR